MTAEKIRKKTIAIGRHISRGLSSIGFIPWLAWCLAIALMLLVFSAQVQDLQDFKSLVIQLVIDISALTLPYWFLPKKYKWWTLIFTWILAIFLISNILYFKYWQDSYSFGQIFHAANYNSFLFSAIPDLWGGEDWFILAIAAIYTALYILFLRKHRGNAKFGKRSIAAGISLIICVAAFLAQNYRIYKWYNQNAENYCDFWWIVDTNFNYADSNIDYYRHKSMAQYIASQTFLLLQDRHLELNEEDYAEIADYFKFHNDVFQSTDSLPDLTGNRNKNLIIIVVESLNSDIVGYRVGERSVTPVIDSIIASGDCLYSLDMVPQIKEGCSSDGQMMYNTGLLPISSGAAIIDFPDNPNYPGLPKQLENYESAEFICEQGAVWNHRLSSRSYGYNTLYDADSISSRGIAIGHTGKDRAVFSFALNELKTARQPFLAFITTLSMHFPFNDPAVGEMPWFKQKEKPQSFYNYLRMTSYFDRALGDFISGLKSEGLYDKSVVVIVSDHDFFVNQYNDKSVSAYNIASPIVFMALNAGLKGKIEKPFGQIDVYPALLDLMNVPERKGEFRGLGTSFITRKVEGAVAADGSAIGTLTAEQEKSLNKAWELSDIIIRSEYDFGGKFAGYAK